MLADKPINERYRAGKVYEAKLRDILFDIWRWDVTESTSQEDRDDKIDGWWTFRGRRRSVQLKTRETGDEFIVDAREPYYGPQNFELGRDMVKPIDDYVVRAGATVYWVTGASLHAIVEEVLREWDAAGSPIVPKERQNPQERISYKQWHPRTIKASVSYQLDRRSQKPKIIVFVSPKAFLAERIKIGRI